MSDRPHVSVLLLNYNYGRYIEEALDSIAAQTHTDYEVVLADDGSTDDSVEIARSHPLDVQVVTGPNLGMAGNFGRGAEQCRGEVLAFLSADDRWLPRHLEVGLRALEIAADAALSYSLLLEVDENGDPIPGLPTVKKRITPTGRIDPSVLLTQQHIPTQGMLLRREAYERVGGFDTALHYLELDLIMRVAGEYPVVFTGDTTVEYRRHGSGLSRNHEEKLYGRLALYDKHLGLEWTPVKRQFVADAYWRTAYQELMDDPSPVSVRRARGQVGRAIRTSPVTLLNRMHLAITVATLLGFGFPPVHRWYRRRLAGSRLKLRAQRIMGMAR